jgi:hypothetical protein
LATALGCSKPNSRDPSDVKFASFGIGVWANVASRSSAAPRGASSGNGINAIVHHTRKLVMILAFMVILLKF